MLACIIHSMFMSPSSLPQAHRGNLGMRLASGFHWQLQLS